VPGWANFIRLGIGLEIRVTRLGDFFANWATFVSSIVIFSKAEVAQRSGNILGFILLQQEIMLSK
jgi:hypothetical protein